MGSKIKGKSKVSGISYKIFNLLLLGVIGFIMIVPFYWTFTGAFKSLTEIMRFPPTWIFFRPTLKNFVELFSTVPFVRYITNSLFVAGTVAIGATTISAMAGYALIRLNFPGRDIIFMIILSTIMIPFFTILIPLFIIMKNFGWVDTYQGLITPYIFSPFSIFLLRQFFLTIPKELEDAAIIDGCSKITVFWEIILPISKPILSTLVVYNFIWSWNDFLWPLVIARSPEKRVIQVGIANFIGMNLNAQWHLIMAACTIALIPALIIFFFFQRYLVEGIKLQGLKE